MSKDGKQVRLDPDVQAALERDTARKGGSLSSAANRALRRGLGLRHTDRPEAEPRPATVTGARGRAAGQRTAGPCRHPVNRRIGEHCAACGAKLK